MPDASAPTTSPPSTGAAATPPRAASTANAAIPVANAAAAIDASGVSAVASSSGPNPDAAPLGSSRDALSVRPASKADLPTVLGFYAQPDFNDGRVVSLRQAEALLDTFARYPDYQLYLAERGGEAVGTFCLMRTDNIAHWGTPVATVESVVVSAQHQRQGVGRLMMVEAARLAREKGCYKLVLSSNVRSTHAHSFYESLGFERYGYSFKLEPPTLAPSDASSDHAWSPLSPQAKVARAERRAGEGATPPQEPRP